MTTAQSQVTELLHRWSNGDLGALDALVPLVYEDLRRLASYYLKQEARQGRRSEALSELREAIDHGPAGTAPL